MKTRTLLSLCFLLLVAAGISFGQSRTDSTHQKQHFVFPKTSMQFSVHPTYGLRGFNGGLISAKYHFSNSLAFRFGLDASINSSNDTRKRKTLLEDTLLISSDFKSSDLYSNVLFVSTFLYYFNPQAQFKFYAGIGPVFGVRYQSRSSESIDNRTTQSQNIALYQAGVQTEYGLEWFVLKNMSLVAQYGFRALYGWYSNETKREHIYSDDRKENTDDSRNGTQYYLNSGIAQFGLSIYF